MTDGEAYVGNLGVTKNNTENLNADSVNDGKLVGCQLGHVADTVTTTVASKHPACRVVKLNLQTSGAQSKLDEQMMGWWMEWIDRVVVEPRRWCSLRVDAEARCKKWHNSSTMEQLIVSAVNARFKLDDEAKVLVVRLSAC